MKFSNKTPIGSLTTPRSDAYVVHRSLVRHNLVCDNASPENFRGGVGVTLYECGRTDRRLGVPRCG